MLSVPIYNVTGERVGSVTFEPYDWALVFER